MNSSLKECHCILERIAEAGSPILLIQNFILDWAEDKAKQDIQYTFQCTFRELNVLTEKKYSFVEHVKYVGPPTLSKLSTAGTPFNFMRHRFRLTAA